MSAVVSFTTHLVNLGAQAGGFRRDVASVARLELDAQTANVLRYVLCDWERAAGVKSNFGAQAERLAAGIFREALHGAHAEAKRRKESAGIKLALDERTFLRRKLPLAERGWPTVTAKPVHASGGGFPMRTIQVSDREGSALCTVGSSEEWAMLPRVVRGWDGPVDRRRVVDVYRALVRLEAATPDGPLFVVTLNLMYGPRSPNADHQTFGALAPLIHLTPTALGLATKATRKLREELAARELPIPDDVSDGGPALAQAIRANAHREVVTPKEAVAATLSRLTGADRRMLVSSLEASARKLLARASNALLHELRGAP